MASPMVDIYVKLATGRTSTLNLLPGEKVIKICEHIGNEEGVPGTLVRLKYQGKMLDKTKTIRYLGVRPETILKGEIVVPKSITVYVKFKDGRCEGITVKNSDTLSYLKRRIHDSSEIPTTKQKITFSGRTLSNDREALYEFGIDEESVVQVDEIVTKTRRSSRSSEVKNQAEPSEELKESVLTSFDNDGKQVEVVFCFDTTGSMASYLNTVRSNLKDTCQRLLRDIPNIRIGIMAHGDYCDYDNYVVRYIDLTSNTQDLVDFAQNTPSTAGGDIPECYEWALRKAQYLDWSEDSAKALVVIGDSEPHEPSYTDQNVYWRTELDVLKGMGVKVYGVFCSDNEDTEAEPFYEEISEHTGGCLLKLAYFDLITQMFLAVCYREAAPEQLDAFTEELKQEGKLTGETKVLMDQFDRKPKKVKVKASKTKKRKITKGWWNPEKHDEGFQCRYEYIVETDKWKPYSPKPHTITPKLSPTNETPTVYHSAIDRTPPTNETSIVYHSVIDRTSGKSGSRRKTDSKLKCLVM